PVTMHALRATDGRMRFCGVWWKAETTADPLCRWDLAESKLTRELARYAGNTLTDLNAAAASPPLGTEERAAAGLNLADAAVKANPSDPNARFARATAFIQLGEDRKALDDLNVVMGKVPQDRSTIQSRALIHARLGWKKEALAELAKFQKGAASESS